MRLLIYQYLLISLSLISTHVQAKEQHFSSGQQQTVLIELYTSEGCSSCPPAEEYLNALKHHPQLWTAYIPVAFHVDYWDYLGWRDPYAHMTHAKRQSWYAKLRNLRTVYTPAFLVNGKAWRPGRLNRELPKSGLKGGELEVTVNGKQLSASYNPPGTRTEKLTLNIAVLAMNQVSQIQAGENTGRTASHEFVVVGYKTLDSTDNHWKTSLPALHYTAAEEYAIAVWLNRLYDPTPLQAAGGKLPQFIE
jgi:hypothetical protein